MAAANILTNTWLSAIKNSMIGMIAKAQYKVGSQYYDAVMQDKRVLSDGRVQITLIFSPTALQGNVTITEVVLRDSADAILAQKTENITVAAEGEGYLYRFHFAVAEVQR